jgi:hypothetical protein
MSKIFSYLWSSCGVEYKLVNEHEIKNDRERIYSYINPDYKNTILIYYKSGAGGLFLANCLALSEKVYTLYPTLESKIEYLNTSLKKQNLFWNDIYLIPPIIEYDTPEHLHKNKYTIIFDHDPKNTKEHLKHWNNIDVIYFTNPDLFCKVRRVLKNYDGVFIQDSVEYIKKYDEKLIPSSISEFNSFEIEKQEQIKEIFKSGENLNSFCFLKNKRLFYIWDTNWYFSEKYTIMKIKELYDHLNFPDFDEHIIRSYYKKWILKLDELKSKKIPNNITDILKDKEYYENSMTVHEDKPPV